ncbi:MAG: tetratricopeptide repeat protein [Saprospiraceae bacterium]|jgi:TolA-binding protein|nr:tetratricopeptide repeat protein [Saprospiraceae bacterium]
MAKKFYQTNRFNKGQQDQTVRQPVEEQYDDEPIVDLGEVKEKATSFWDHNRNLILGVVGGLILVVGGWFGYNNLIKGPKQQRAVDQMFQAELMFEKDSFQLALTNPGGGYSGFIDIINNYGGTPAGNTAKYYAGICYLNMGDFENAVKYLEDYSPSGTIIPAVKYSALGDAYAEQNKMDEAEKNYKKAAAETPNDVVTPYMLKKLGLFYEKQNKNDLAMKAYQDVKNEYLRSSDGRDIEKYIIRLQSKMGK